jgi:hypothetical protein
MRHRIVPAILLAAHIGAAVWIAMSYRRTENQWLLLAVSALPLAQTSVLALWGVWGSGPAFVRAPIVAVAVTVVWAVDCHALALRSNGPLSAAYALTLVVQTLLVGGLLGAVRGYRSIRSRRGPEKSDGRMRFGIGRLFGWVAASAVVLGVGKLVLSRAGWSVDVVQHELFRFGLVVGVYNAAFALIVLAAVWRRQVRRGGIAQAVAALLLVCATASSQAVVLKTLFGADGGVDALTWMTQAGFQALYLWLTLVPIRLCQSGLPKEPGH